MHVQLQFKGNPVPLPEWFVKGHNAKLTKFSMLDNFPSYLKNIAEEHPESILTELEKRQYYKPKGRPPYSTQVIRYALLLRYTSLQAYKLLLEKLPLPSISLLNKIQHGGIDAIKAVKCLLLKEEISKDVVLMVDEMYLSKEAQYSGGEFIGADSNGDLYKGIVVFMICGLKKSVSFVVKACPETKINGKWLSQEVADCISLLGKSGFSVRAVVCDNHSANVNAFNHLLRQYNAKSSLFIKHPDCSTNTYLFFDTVHLMKNIRNNLFNTKKFAFLAFTFKIMDNIIEAPNGYITWSDLNCVYERDNHLNGNLKKAPKLTYKALHPENNKQNVDLALAIIHDTTIAAMKNYFPKKKDAAGFLTLINTWWQISNSCKKSFHQTH